MLQFRLRRISKQFWVAGVVLGTLLSVGSYAYTYQGQPSHLWPSVYHHFGSMIDYDGSACDLTGTVPFNVSYGWPLPYWGQSGTFTDSGCGHGVSRIMPLQFIIDACLYTIPSLAFLYLIRFLYRVSVGKIKRRWLRRFVLVFIAFTLIFGIRIELMITSEEPLPLIGCLPGRQVYYTGIAPGSNPLCMTPQENNTWIQQYCPNGLCPICLSQNTMIDTPDGPKRVTLLHPGELIWSTNTLGQRIIVPIIRTTRRQVPAHIYLLSVTLADKRHLLVSPNHPTSAYVPFKDLRTGQSLDGSPITSITAVDYTGGYTYDLLPQSPSGDYWANDILVGSTLKNLR